MSKKIEVFALEGFQIFFPILYKDSQNEQYIKLERSSLNDLPKENYDKARLMQGLCSVNAVH